MTQYRRRKATMQERRVVHEERGHRRRDVLLCISIDLWRSDWRDRSWKRHRGAQHKVKADREG